MPANLGTKSVNIQVDAHTLLVKEVKRLSVSQAEYVTTCVRYFAERGLNPMETEAREGQLIMQQVKKLGDRVFSYMQEQERGLLMPMLEEMLRIKVTLDQLLRLNEIFFYAEALRGEIVTVSGEMEERHKAVLGAIKNVNDGAINTNVNAALSGVKQRGPGKKK